MIYLATCAEDDMLARAKLTEPFGYLLKPFSAQGLKASIKKGVIGCEATNRPFYASQAQCSLRCPVFLPLASLIQSIQFPGH